MLPGNPKVHSKALSGIRDCSGDPSLQNSLEMAARGLEYVPIWNIQFQKSIFNIIQWNLFPSDICIYTWCQYIGMCNPSAYMGTETLGTVLIIYGLDLVFFLRTVLYKLI